MSKVVIDTSIFINFLRDRSDKLVRLVERKYSEQLELLIPDIVIVELFAGNDAKNRTGRKRLEHVLEHFPVVGLSGESSRMAGEFIRRYKQIPDPFDLLIAAIAIEHDAYVATENVKHFKQIKNVKLFV